MRNSRMTKIMKILCLFFILCISVGCWGDDDDDDGDPDGGGGGEDVLTVASTSPSNGSLGVERDVQIDITFSEPIDPNTLTGDAITLTTGGIAIPGTLTLNETGTILRITPAFPLASHTTYDVTVTNAVRDLQGNALSSDFTFSFTTVESPALGRWIDVSAGFHNAAALNENGTLWVWGCNAMGQLGNDLHGVEKDTVTSDEETLTPEQWERKHRYDAPLPVQLGGTPDWATVSAGRESIYYIMKNGMLWVSGQGPFGGEGYVDTPLRFGVNPEWESVEASIGTMFACAVKTDGTLWSWGTQNAYGQLGNGTNTGSSTPARVGSDSTWKTVSAGAAHAVAVRDDGTLWAWGDNVYGELGDGTGGDATHDHDANVPKQVGAETGWTSAHARGAFSMAVKTDGTLWAWGDNSKGQLGIGASGDANSPRQVVGGDSSWKVVAPGWNHVAAIRTDGTLWTWGGNEYGQLGDGSPSTYSRNAPRQIGGETTWSTVSSGGYFSVAIKTDGSLWSWGLNKYYQLGNGGGRTENKFTPMQIQSVQMQ